MEAMKLAGLEPAAVFGYFEKICSIPHGSQNTKMISDYLVQFARERDITYIQDEDNNVIFFQEGTCGLEKGTQHRNCGCCGAGSADRFLHLLLHR